MKIKIFIISIIAVISFNSFAQDKFIAGFNGSYYNPFGSLHQRFTSVPGGSIYFGKEVSDKWTWVGRLEHFKYNKQNEDLTFKKNQNDVDYTFSFPDELMTLQITGLSANAFYKVLKNDLFETNLNFGFGIYRWEYERKAYKDSLFSTENGSEVFVAEVVLPPNRQQDWSGGFYVGADANVFITSFLAFNIGANYKVIVGEMWSALEVDLENVSTFQMFDLKAGLQFKF